MKKNDLFCLAIAAGLTYLVAWYTKMPDWAIPMTLLAFDLRVRQVPS